MVNHIDFCTHVKFAEEADYLTDGLFGVNMRLFHSCKPYKEIVQKCCEHIKWCACNKKDGYRNPAGWSGANAGIPWNIIAYRYREGARAMINPVYESVSNEMETVKSNCGSLTLTEPVAVERFKMIRVQFFDIHGLEHAENFNRGAGGYTIQHEIEHNEGLLLEDK